MINSTRHWLLNLARLDPARLDWILPKVAGQALNVREIPGWSPRDYADALGQLLDEGQIRVTIQTRESSTDEAKYVISRFLAGQIDRNTSIRLTELGGRTWEGLAQARWDRFVETENVYRTKENGEDYITGLLASQNRDLVIACLGWYEPFQSNLRISWPTLKWITHTEYNITYWKRLPDVHEVTFECIRILERAWVREPEWLRSWMFSLADWHTRPWNRADWPGREG